MESISDGALILENGSKHFEDYYCDISAGALCRLCLERNLPKQGMYNIFEPKPGSFTTDILSSMIMACTSIQILNGDGLPNTICDKCMAKLDVAWQFKVQCEDSDTKLRQYYFGGTQMQITSFESLSYGSKGESGFCGGKQDSPLAVTFTSLASDLLSCSEVMPSETLVNLQPLADDKQPKISKKGKRQKSHRKLKVHQCDTCGKTFNRREYLTQHIRIHTGEKPYKCHLCEKCFVNSGHLTTHMRTHTGERPHGCSLCPKAFSTRQELQKHTMVHNGERPFSCKMCGKSFSSSSNMYAHLKHHTGEKNFTCEHCGKAFYTKQELRQHLVIHTGEKAFICEYCDKRFSQIAHLRRHVKLHYK